MATATQDPTRDPVQAYLRRYGRAGASPSSDDPVASYLERYGNAPRRVFTDRTVTVAERPDVLSRVRDRASDLLGALDEFLPAASDPRQPFATESGPGARTAEAAAAFARDPDTRQGLREAPAAIGEGLSEVGHRYLAGLARSAEGSAARRAREPRDPLGLPIMPTQRAVERAVGADVPDAEPTSVLSDAVRASREANRAFYPDPESALGQALGVGTQFVGEGALFLAPGAGAARALEAGGAATEGSRFLRLLASPGVDAEGKALPFLRAAGERAAQNALTGAPLDAAVGLGSEPEESLAGFLGEVTDSDALRRASENPAARTALEVALSFGAGEVLGEGLELFRRGVRGAEPLLKQPENAPVGRADAREPEPTPEPAAREEDVGDLLRALEEKERPRLPTNEELAAGRGERQGDFSGVRFDERGNPILDEPAPQAASRAPEPDDDALARVPDSAFNGDLEASLERIFLSDEFDGDDLALTSRGFRDDEVTALEAAGLATGGRMTRAQWGAWMEERSKRLSGGRRRRAASPAPAADDNELLRALDEPEDAEPERIRSAAFRTPDGQHFEGGMHSAAYDQIPAGRFADDELEEGFMTTRDRFVDRDEARHIAAGARQAPMRDEPIYAEEVDYGPDSPFNAEPEVTPEPTPRAARGRRERTLFPGDGSKVETEYQLVEADELVPSHDPVTFDRQPEDRYPAAIQGRAYHGDRGRAAREEVERVTAVFDPDQALDPTTSADGGVPVVTDRGIAVAGNQRVMLLQRLPERNPEAAAAYRRTLAERADAFGVDPRQVEGMRNPVLVRRIVDPSVDPSDVEQLRRLNAASDAPKGKTKDALSDAATRADTLRRTRAALPHFTQTIGDDDTIRGYLETAAGRRFAQLLVEEGVVTLGERARFFDAATGAVTPEGKQMVERVILSTVVGDADVVARAPDGALRKIEKALPAILRTGRLEQYDLAPVLREALDILSAARANGQRGFQIGGQADAFAAPSEEAARLAQFIDIHSPNEVAEAIRGYAADAESAARALESDDMFGFTPPAPAEAARTRFTSRREAALEVGNEEGAAGATPSGAGRGALLERHFGETGRQRLMIQPAGTSLPDGSARPTSPPSGERASSYRSPSSSYSPTSSAAKASTSSGVGTRPYLSIETPPGRPSAASTNKLVSGGEEIKLDDTGRVRGWSLDASPEGQRRLRLRDRYRRRVGAQERVRDESWRQPVDSGEELYDLAVREQPNLIRKMKEWGRAAGSAYDGIVDPGVKPHASFMEKVGRKNEKAERLGESVTARVIGDVNRGTIMARDLDGLRRIIDRIRRDGVLVELDDFFDQPTLFGYGAYHLQVRLDSGAIAEVQLTTPHMWDARHELGGHDIYDLYEKRPLARDAVADAVQDIEYSRRVYNEAMEQALRGAERPKRAHRLKYDFDADRWQVLDGRGEVVATDGERVGDGRDLLERVERRSDRPPLSRPLQVNLFDDAATPTREGQASLDLGDTQPRARQVTSLLEGKVRRGTATAAERRLYEEARSATRAGESIDAEEVRARPQTEAGERTAAPEDNGELFDGSEPASPLHRGWAASPGLSVDADLAGLADRIRSEHGLEALDLQRGPGGVVHLDWIKVPRGAREKGAGSAAMRDLTKWADENGETITLQVADRNPSTGTTSRARLVKFYKRFGFIENRGRNKDFALSLYASMYRRPKAGGAKRAPGLSAEVLPDAGRFTDEGRASAPRTSEIVRSIAEAFQIKISEGRLGRGARDPRRTKLGVNQLERGRIGLRSAADVGTLWHEIGHETQKLFFGLTRGGITDAPLERFAHELRPLAKPIDGSLVEGWAELWRRWLDNPEAARRAAPETLAYIERRLDEFPAARVALEKGRDDWLLHRTAGPEARLDSHISTNEDPAHFALVDEWSRFRTGVVDHLEPVRHVVDKLTDGKPVLAEDAERLARLVNGSSGQAEHFLEYGTLDFHSLRRTGRSLKEILEPVLGNIDEFRRYIVARRAAELHAAGIETGLRDADVQTVIRRSDARFGESFKPAFDGLQEYQRALLDYLADAGVLTREAVDAMTSKWGAYVPFYRVAEDGSVQGGGKGSGFGHLFSPVKRISGSGRDIIDPLESIVKNTFVYADIAARQRVSQAFARLAERPGAARFIEQIATPMRPVKLRGSEIEKRLEDILGEGVWRDMKAEAGDAVADFADEVLMVFRPGDYFSKPNVISVLVDGERKWYELHPELAEALKGGAPSLFADFAAGGLASRILRGAATGPSRLLRAGATLAPEFQLRNPARDTLMAGVQSQYGFIPVVDTLRGLFHMLRRDDLYQRWLASGGSRSALLSLDRKNVQNAVRELLRHGAIPNVIKNPIDGLRALSAHMENASRLGEFGRAVRAEGDEGEGLLRAGLASRGVTTDFARHGGDPVVRALASMTAFWNARIQGYDSLYRAFKERPARALGMAFSTITVPSVLLHYAHRDDPEYWEIPQWKRDLFWHLWKQDDGEWVVIPKPFELGLIFGTLPERVLEWHDSEDAAGLTAFMETLGREVATTFAPIPTFLTPLIENVTNYSFFLRRPLAPRSQDEVDPKFQETGSTSEVAKLIARWLPGETSAIEVDNLLRAYTGGLGRVVTDVVDRAAEAAGQRPPEPDRGASGTPGVRGLMTARPGFSSESIERFYRAFEEARSAQATVKFLEREERFDELDAYLARPEVTRAIAELDGYRNTADQLARLRAEREIIERDPDMDPEEKRTQIEELGAEATVIARETIGRRTPANREE